MTISHPLGGLALHLREAMAAGAVSLTESELAWLELGETVTEGARQRGAATWA